MTQSVVVDSSIVTVPVTIVPGKDDKTVTDTCSTCSWP
jgi:alpha-beta hydrolase superfamily lysophospholipase